MGGTKTAVTKKKQVDVIETNIIFAVDVKVHVKVRRSCFYGNPNPEYMFVEIAGVTIPSNMFDEGKKADIIRNIEREALAAVEKELPVAEGE